MYQFTQTENDIVSAARGIASASLVTFNRQTIDDNDARQFLVREILRLHREGEGDPDALAKKALGLLREHIQVRESVHRITRPTEPNW